LIKEFPNSPKLGTELYLNIHHNSKIPNYLHWVDQIGVMHKLDSPENYPEFWKKVVEKDYLIKQSSFTRGVKTIQSVIRLSDGQVFEVRDEIITPISESVCFIYDFLEVDDRIVVSCTHSYLASKMNIDIFSTMQRAYKPILITEDGVEIFEGDEFYYVDNWFDCWNATTEDEDFRRIFKCFSTKEAADRYVEDNKPMYNKKDILNILTRYLHGKGYKPCLSILALFEEWKKEKGE